MEQTYEMRILETVVTSLGNHLEVDEIHEELVEIYGDVLRTLIDEGWSELQDAVGICEALDEALKCIDPDLFD